MRYTNLLLTLTLTLTDRRQTDYKRTDYDI